MRSMLMNVPSLPPGPRRKSDEERRAELLPEAKAMLDGHQISLSAAEMLSRAVRTFRSTGQLFRPEELEPSEVRDQLQAVGALIQRRDGAVGVLHYALAPHLCGPAIKAAKSDKPIDLSKASDRFARQVGLNRR